MSSNKAIQSLLDKKEDTDSENTVPVEVLTEKLPEIVVDTQLPVISSNFELFKQKLEIVLKKFDLKVDENNVDKANDMATELNGMSKKILSFKKEKTDVLLAPINAFKAECSTLDTLIQTRRQKLLQQIKVFEDIERAECLGLLKKELALQYVKFGVKVEFQSVKVDDLAIISNKTKTGLSKKARDLIETRTLDCKRFQERIELRLTTLEGVCLKAGLEAPLTRDLIESFLKESDDELYEKKLNYLIASEIKRLATMKAKIEQNAQVEAEAKAKARAQLVAQQEPSVHVNQNKTPPNTIQVHQQNTQPTSQHKTTIKLTGNVKKYVVTAVFEVEVDEAYAPYLKSSLLKKFNQACITTLPEISIAEKQEEGNDNVSSGPQKEGSDF